MNLTRKYVVTEVARRKGCANRHEPDRLIRVSLSPVGGDGQVFTLTGSEQELGGLDIDDRLTLIVTDRIERGEPESRPATP